MIGPVTKNAILGVIFGVISISLWAALSRQMPVATGVVIGFAGGLTGGIVWGTLTRFVHRRA